MLVRREKQYCLCFTITDKGKVILRNTEANPLKLLQISNILNNSMNQDCSHKELNNSRECFLQFSSEYCLPVSRIKLETYKPIIISLSVWI
jgi:hypothetical protein